MYCRNCGAAVVGKFCSCCGYKVRDEKAEFRLTQIRTFKAYKKQFDNLIETPEGRNVSLAYLADACWLACEHKQVNDYIKKNEGTYPYCVWELMPGAYERLEIVKEHATRLFERLVNADDY